MYEDENVVIYDGSETRLDDHPYISKRSGRPRCEQHLMSSPETGMLVKLIRYPAGQPCPIHHHEKAKAMYVLKGHLRTEHGVYGPGSFIWWKPGAEMFHGSTANEDCDCLFIMDGPYDFFYHGEEV